MTPEAPNAMTVLGGRELVETPLTPVFIHSSWRTASTWLWSKLRPTAMAYCEIFHEGLADCTIPNLRGNDFSRWNSKHPKGAPYFLEFASLVGKNGVVRGYDGSMATDLFLPSGGLQGELSAAERVYIDGLVENAVSQRKKFRC